MNNLKSFFSKFNEEYNSDENEKYEALKCVSCNKFIALGEMYIKDEDFKIYCSKKCYLENLNSKYY